MTSPLNEGGAAPAALSDKVKAQIEAQQERRLQALLTYRDTLADLRTDVPEGNLKDQWGIELQRIDDAVAQVRAEVDSGGDAEDPLPEL